MQLQNSKQTNTQIKSLLHKRYVQKLNEFQNVWILQAITEDIESLGT